MSWWKAWFRRRAFDAQLENELRFHMEKLTEEGLAAGLEPEEARRRARLEFGGQEQFKDQLRDLHRAAALEQLGRHFARAIRLLRRSPAFSITVILTLGLGIGANSAVFSAIHAVLLRPLPFPQSDRLMLLDQRSTGQQPITIAPVRLEDWNRMNSTFEAITGYYSDDLSETSGALPEKVTAAVVTPRFFQVWGIAPAIGRSFTPEEEQLGGRQAIVISGRYWRRRFGADPGVIGRTIRLGSDAPVVVGIMPESFLFPDREVEIWRPGQFGGPLSQNRELTWLRGIGRLKPGVTLEQARTDLANLPGAQPIGRHLEEVPRSPYTRPIAIIGLAGDARENGLHNPPGPVAYWCFSGADASPQYLIRTHGEPLRMVEAIRRKIHEIEPLRSVYDVSLLEQSLDDMYAENRLRTILLTLFAGTAVSLACLGLYGTLAYLVSIRRREVGLRIALGAARGSIVSRIVFQGLKVAVLGCVAGLGLSAFLVGVLTNMLYNVSPWDTVTFAGVAALVLATSALASLAPAVKASRVEPMQVLRDE